MERQVGMCLEFFAAFILLMVLICCISEKNKTPLLKSYIYMVTSCFTALFTEACSLALYERQGIDWLLATLNTISLFSGYCLAYAYARYIAILVGADQERTKKAMQFVYDLGILATCVLVLGSFFGWFFRIKNGVFIPSGWLLAAFTYDVVACLVGILLIATYRKTLRSRDIIALCSFPVLLLISAIMQYLIYKISVWLFLLAMVSVFIIYLMIQADRNKQKAEQEKRLMNMNIAMMRSQIQPHFLYNALSSIRRMIKKDPEVAETAIENFSMYLRQNLESMNRVEPIPFTTELQHLREYLYLEKLRFGERLNVEFEVGFSDFVLPVLTLQPIVENAVKHGILKKEEGGSVWIKTYREGGDVVLRVTDDGVGFDPNAAIHTGRMHIGFQNVKKRIEMQCRGTVNIESKIGEGTTVTMTIPLMYQGGGKL